MSILINMEMPKNCHNCELSATVNLHYGVGCCCQPLAEMIENAFERKSNCPLVEVPDGHGRLIDVNELKEWVENWFEVNRFYHPYSKTNNIPIPDLYDILEHMPTVIPADKGGD